MGKYIVTGGAGFIGSHVVDRLIDGGHEVHVIDNLLSGKEENINRKAVFHVLDIRDRDLLKGLFRDIGAEGVFHLAAQPRMQYSILEPELTHDINVTGTLNVLIAARDAGVGRVVYSASSSAYGDSKILPLTEVLPPAPTVPYAVQKYMGEQSCQMVSRIYGLQTVCLRYFNVYGPRQTTDADGPYATVIGIFLGQREKDQPMTIVPDGNQRRDFTYVRDVANANLLAMESDNVGTGEVINIGTGENHSVLEVAEHIGGPHVFVEARQGEARATLADWKRARHLLSWRPNTQFDEGILILKQMHGIE